ncbi:hypothetical protein VP01_1355g4 [Puccinia sorghi]|uniref:Tet-like 2OG-Fe(II) oxygenase domain-containing protein n=1 Tax=Puccinia sorghi TaxID=27349 RepID=A0A0L6VM63_9BASI|nr:hypothetical protein VP01_1355g4 [Puccinia sorghi]
MAYTINPRPHTASPPTPPPLLLFQANFPEKDGIKNERNQKPKKAQERAKGQEGVKLSPHNIYSIIPWVDNKPTTTPLPRKLKKLILKFKPLNEDSIIAIIEFTSFEKLNPPEKDDLNLISTFLQDCKRFMRPVSSFSQVCGGLMWAIGWRG